MKRALIIDDEKSYRDTIATVLKRDNYEVQCAMNYDESIQALEKGTDLALIDIRLDDKDDLNTDGLKILEWIKKNKPNVSAYVMSAYKEFSYAEQALNLGAKYFFRKPIDFNLLKSVFKEKEKL